MGPRLLLINPAMTLNGRRRSNAGGMATMEPLNLAYVAALTPEHWDIRIVDEVVEDLPTDYQPDVVGLTSLSVTAPRAYEIAAHYRRLGVPVVMGGVHASVMPDEATRYVDAVVEGDAEGKWPLLIHDLEKGELKRRYKGNAATLSGLPRPRRDLYHRRYFMQLMSASRGCRFRCEFCTLWKLAGGRYRARPLADVLEELEAARKRRPLLFTDENLYTDRQWTLALFEGMRERGFKRPYAIQASLNLADDEQMLAALQRSGCMTVLIGFESISEESLRVMRKGVNLKVGVAQYKSKIAKLHDHGLAVSGSFIFGTDGDGPDIFDRTVEFVLGSGLDLAHLAVLTPNPGTELYDRLAREGRLLYTDFPSDHARYDLQTAVFRPLRMTPEQLEEGLLRATRAVGSWSVALRRAWGTWRVTKNLVMPVMLLRWSRSAQASRIRLVAAEKSAEQHPVEGHETKPITCAH